MMSYAMSKLRVKASDWAYSALMSDDWRGDDKISDVIQTVYWRPDGRLAKGCSDSVYIAFLTLR